MFEKIIRSTDNPFGFVLHRGGEGRPGIIWLHGKDGQGDGSDTSLQRILTNGEIPLVLQQGVQNSKFWLFAPQMSSGWTQQEVTAMFAYIASNNLAVNLLQMNLVGFSMGGGEIIRWLSKSLENAKKIACAIIIAPTGATPSRYIADAKVACWFHVNSGDTLCPPSNVTSQLAAINVYNPIVKAVKTIYNAPEHGGEKEACGLTPPSAPGGQGLTASKVTMYEWFEINKQGSPVAVPEITGLLAYAGADRTVTQPNIELDGTGSKNYVNHDFGWELLDNDPANPLPEGVGKWGVITSGGGWITAKATLPKPGTYPFQLTVKDAAGNIATDKVVITYAPDGTPPPPPPPAEKTVAGIALDFINKKAGIIFSDFTQKEISGVAFDGASKKLTITLSDTATLQVDFTINSK